MTTAWKDRQSDMSQEIIGGFSETREEAVSMFIQIIVKARCRMRAQELVKEPAASSQLASVIKHVEIPRVHIHA